MRISDWSSDVCSSDLIRTLGRFNVRGERREGRVGIWVDRGGGREEKIGAIGVRIRHWVSFHGFALNVDPDLDHFAGIVPCGIAEHGVTSLTALGLPVSMAEVDAALKASFRDVFGGGGRSEERRVGKECGSTCRYRGSPEH